MQCDQGHDEKRKRSKMAKETMGVGIAIKRGLCNLGFDGQIGVCHTDWGDSLSSAAHCPSHVYRDSPVLPLLCSKRSPSSLGA